jgi:hypothetical protein
MHVCGLGSFQAARMVLESSIRHEGTKPFQSDLAMADVFVAIDT